MKTRNPRPTTPSSARGLAWTAVFAAALALGLSGLVAAQPGQGLGAGPGMQGTGLGAGHGRLGAGMRAMYFDQLNTRGWTLMTPAERVAHQAKMRAAATYEDCKRLQEEQHQTMQARAQEKGVVLAAPRSNGCDVARARGWLK